jgi:formamidopyrimidine-DNA glycosylase
MAGQRFVDVGRRGKYVVCALASGEALLVHLRMTGRLEVVGPDSPALVGPHLRASLQFTDGEHLAFTDPRKFGRIWLTDDVMRVVGKLGPEPLGGDFTTDVLARRLSARRAAMKALLLDQTVVAGLGNIYADESLFVAGLHPLRTGADLTEIEIERLHAAIRQVLDEAIGERGTTLRDYHPPYGAEGAYQNHLRVYQQTDRPCPRCGAPIRRIRVTQRSTHFCPQCQHADAVIAVATAA